MAALKTNHSPFLLLSNLPFSSYHDHLEGIFFGACEISFVNRQFFFFGERGGRIEAFHLVVAGYIEGKRKKDREEIFIFPAGNEEEMKKSKKRTQHDLNF